MSGGVTRITLATGEEYEVPSDQAQEAMQAIAAKGVKFDAREALGDMTVGEPEVIKSAPAPAPVDDRPWYSKLFDRPDYMPEPAPGIFSEQGMENLRTGVPAAAAGFSEGYTSSLADDALGTVSPAAGQAVRDVWKQQRAEQPGPYMVGDTAGMFAQPIGRGLRAMGIGATGGVMSQAIEAGANAGLSAGSRAYGQSEEADPRLRAIQGLQAAGQGALTAGGISAIAGGAEKAMDAGSVMARRYAMGGREKDYRELVDEYGVRNGLDYAQNELGRLPEAQGLTNRLIPQSRAQLATRAEDRLNQTVGPAIGQSLERAATEIPGDVFASPLNNPRDRVMHEIAGRAQATEQAARPGARQLDQALRQVDAAPFDTPAEMAALKRQFEDQSYAKGVVPQSREGLYANAQRQAADVTRGELRRVMGEASPETNATWQQANQDYADTALIKKLASRGATSDLAAPLLLGASGAALGGYGGYRSRGDVSGAAIGAAGGAMVGAGLRSYGPDLAANALRLSASGAAALEDATPGLVKYFMLRDGQSESGDPASDYDEDQRRKAQGL